jgi:hypothetical protein
LLQPINNARTLSGPGFQDLDIWLSGPGFQDFNVRFQDLALKTWVSGRQHEVSGPGSQDLGFKPSTRGFRTWLSGPGFQTLGIWLSGPGFQDLENSPSYGRLIFFPSLFSTSTITFLCVQWSQTDAQTDYVNLYIRLSFTSGKENIIEEIRSRKNEFSVQDS